MMINDATFALNHKEIGKKIEIMFKIEPFIGKYNWERINCG